MTDKHPLSDFPFGIIAGDGEPGTAILPACPPLGFMYVISATHHDVTVDGQFRVPLGETRSFVYATDDNGEFPQWRMEAPR